MRATASAAPRETRKRFSMADIHKGKRKAPDKILLYGVKGVGKSSWGADAPSPIFIASEEGVDHLDVASWHPKSYDEVLDCIALLTEEQHDYKTLVIDTIDWVEHVVRDKVIAENRDKSGRPWTTADYQSYGQGVKLAADEFRKLIRAMEKMQKERGMEVILLAHCISTNFKNPTGEDYQIYKPAMTGDLLPNLFGDWVNALLFATYDITVQRGEGWKKNKAHSDGSRVVYTTYGAAWDAKNRWGLPAAIELNYKDYATFRDAERSASVTAMLEEVTVLRGKLEVDDDQAKKLDGWIAKAGEHPAHLQKVIDTLAVKLNEQGGDDAAA